MSLVINHNSMSSNVARNLNDHYGKLSTSTQRLSTGLRVNSAADDAAGLAIRELQRADIATLRQGARNANDAISMIQTADGALQIIDEKLIRMKELAEQAATGTYDSTQRLMIDSEFQAMAAEIDRIANATDFNGIKILDGNLSNAMNYNNSIKGQGEPKITVNSILNNTVQDVNSSQNGDITNNAVTLYMHYKFDGDYSDSTGLNNNAVPLNNVTFSSGPDGQVAHIQGNASDNSLLEPTGGNIMLPPVDWSLFGDSLTLSIWVYEEEILSDGESYICFNGASSGQYSSNNQGFVEIFRDNSRKQTQYRLGSNVIVIGKSTPDSPADASYLTGGEDAALNDRWVNHVMTLDNGIFSVYEDGNLLFTKNGVNIGTTTSHSDNNAIGRHWWENGARTSARFVGSVDNLMLYSGALSADEVKQLYNGTYQNPTPVPKPSPNPAPAPSPSGDVIPDNVVKIHFGTGNDSAEDYYYINKSDATLEGLGLNDVSIETQDKAQKALDTVNDAIVKKDNIRAYYGAMQNRLENTISNLNIQAENLLAAESRISDVDIATEMTEFVREQILTQASVAMLSQANSMPKMAMQLISG